MWMLINSSELSLLHKMNWCLPYNIKYDNVKIKHSELEELIRNLQLENKKLTKQDKKVKRHLTEKLCYKK